MSVVRHHAEWLSLVEPSGPFLSLQVLCAAFPQGLPPHDPDRHALLRAAYAEWQQSATSRRPDPALHRAYLDLLLRRVLGITPAAILSGPAIPASLCARVPEHNDTLTPDLVIANPPHFASQSAALGRATVPGAPRLLINLYPPGQHLERLTPGAGFRASPATRMVELCRQSGVPLGLCYNGERLLFVNARTRNSGFASFYSDILIEDPITQRALCALLGDQRLFGVTDDDLLESLLARSLADQQAVTDQLGRQVRTAVELLIQAIDRCDRERGFALLRGLQSAAIYQGALAVMMRLCFLLCAEERGLLLAGQDLYDSAYAISTLRDQLRRAADHAGEEVLERRHDAWARILALFRAVHGGVHYQDLQLPAYGGALFDPDRYPFLEGRAPGSAWRDTPADPLPIHNRTVLHLLDSLQMLQVRLPGGGPAEATPQSFRTFSPEQIGYIYEGLLDHTAVRASGAVLALSALSSGTGKGGRGDDAAEVPLAALEAALQQGPEPLLAHLQEATGRSEAALRKLLHEDAAETPAGGATTSAQRPPRGRPRKAETSARPQTEGMKGLDQAEQARVLVACDNDSALYQRVLPFRHLLKRDPSGYPVVFPQGSIYVTAGADRRSTGTHYTPPELTETLVAHALEPLCFSGPAEGAPREAWRLRSPRELLALRVCDLAMGSGAFLVAACRYLAERLREAWRSVEAAAGPGAVLISPEGEVSSGAPPERLLPRAVPPDDEERLTLAKRLVADRCLYGVDINPMAAEMAKVSLWLETLQRDRPFTFLDHALRSGDSLLGLAREEQLQRYHLARDFAPQPRQKELRALIETGLLPALERAKAKRRALESFATETLRDAERKAALLAEAEAEAAPVRLVADLLVGAGLYTAGRGKDALEQRLETFHQDLSTVLDSGRWDLSREVEKQDYEARKGKLWRQIEQLFEERRAPEQPRRRPFHFVLEFPEIFLADKAEERGFDAIVGNPPFVGGQRITGALGTDYRDYLVAHLASGQRGSADLCAYFFLRAAELLRPQGMAGLIATNTIAQGDTREVGLEQLVHGGVSLLRAVPSVKWPGDANLEVAQVWLRRGGWGGPYFIEEREVPAITPFLTEPGETEGKPFRLEANEGKSFQGSIVLGMGFVLEPEAAQALIEKDGRNREVLFPYLNGEDLNSRWDQSASRWVINFRDWPLDRESAPQDYEGKVAADFPDCLEIVTRLVKPEREKNNRKVYRDRWWHYAEKRPEFYATIEGMHQIMARARIANRHAIALLPNIYVFNEKMVIFPGQSFALLQSGIHEEWARQYSSTLRTDMQYTPSDCFETFPFPQDLTALEDIGRRYHDCRQAIMAERQQGLTKTYNRFHDPEDQAEDICGLRALHVQMDQSVAAAYGFSALDLGHGFHPTRQGLRYTLSEPARRKVLGLLLQLNHARHAAEEAQRAQAAAQRTQAPAPAKAPTPKPKKTPPKKPPAQGDLF